LVKLITGSDIALFLGKTLHGKSLSVSKPADLSECGPNDLVWVRNYSEERLNILESLRPALVICDHETAQKTTIPHISSENPRLDFIRILNHFYKPPLAAGIDSTAIIGQGALIGLRAHIGAYTRIAKTVSIGENCLIGSGISIEGDVAIGNRCVIKANSVLGGQGFGFEYDENGRPIHFPHLGKIIIEDDVWIGACSTVEIGALGATKIGQGCKIDDLVQIGHNVHIGFNTLIMANSVICGGAIIGENCWIAPNSVIKQKVRIGNRVTVGLGSVVLKDVDDGCVVAGVPAGPLKPKLP